MSRHRCCERRRRRAGRAVAAALVLALGAPAAARATEPDAAETRRIMREVFDAMRRTLPPSLDDERFSDPERRAEIARALATLARHAETLAEHGERGGQGFAFLSRSLARDARDLEQRYAAGRFGEAQFLLHGLTDACVACHARLPDPDDARLAERFLDEREIAALDAPDRAQLAMATRQFERALDAHEEILRSREFDVSSIDLLGYLDDYLEVCVRVKGDYERPARALEAFAKRSDLRPQLREQVTRWVADLRRLGARAPIDGFEAGRELARAAEAELGPLEERDLLVRYQAASGALHRFVAERPERGARAAEAYYWLGVIESRIGRSFWLSQTEPYLEAAIRLAPGEPIAREAYAMLEEFVVGSYSGSGGTHVPDDVRAWLDELAHLITEAEELPEGSTAPEQAT